MPQRVIFKAQEMPHGGKIQKPAPQRRQRRNEIGTRRIEK